MSAVSCGLGINSRTDMGGGGEPQQETHDRSFSTHERKTVKPPHRGLATPGQQAAPHYRGGPTSTPHAVQLPRPPGGSRDGTGISRDEYGGLLTSTQPAAHARAFYAPPRTPRPAACSENTLGTQATAVWLLHNSRSNASLAFLGEVRSPRSRRGDSTRLTQIDPV